MHGHECCHAAPKCQCPRGSQAIQVDIYARHVGDASLLAHQAIVTMTELRPYRNGRQRLRPIQGMQALPCRFWPGWQAGPSVRQAPCCPELADLCSAPAGSAGWDPRTESAFGVTYCMTTHGRTHSL
jgi:hypothetical protein